MVTLDFGVIPLPGLVQNSGYYRTTELITRRQDEGNPDGNMLGGVFLACPQFILGKGQLSTWPRGLWTTSDVFWCHPWSQPCVWMFSGKKSCWRRRGGGDRSCSRNRRLAHRLPVLSALIPVLSNLRHMKQLFGLITKLGLMCRYTTMHLSYSTVIRVTSLSGPWHCTDGEKEVFLDLKSTFAFTLQLSTFISLRKGNCYQPRCWRKSTRPLQSKCAALKPPWLLQIICLQHCVKTWICFILTGCKRRPKRRWRRGTMKKARRGRGVWRAAGMFPVTVG